MQCHRRQQRGWQRRSPFHGTLMDVGGGSGNMQINVLQQHPQVTGILFELPHVAEAARANVHAARLSERCTQQTGNVFEGVPRGADLYLLSHSSHDWDEQRYIQILSNCRKAMKADARTLLIEVVAPGPNQPQPAKELDRLMLTVPGGRERTEAEYRLLLENAGLTKGHVIPTSSPLSMLEAQT